MAKAKAEGSCGPVDLGGGTERSQFSPPVCLSGPRSTVRVLHVRIACQNKTPPLPPVSRQSGMKTQLFKVMLQCVEKLPAGVVHRLLPPFVLLLPQMRPLCSKPVFSLHRTIFEII